MSVHVPAKGWFGWVVHPDTGRPLQLDVLSDPRISPSINSLPQIRLPVPKSPQWQTLSGEPDLNVYLDGVEQPIDELTKPIDAKGAATTALQGRGGVELLERVSAEYGAETRYEAAKDIIAETSYQADVPTPASTTTRSTVQSPDSTQEFSDLAAWGDDIPLVVENGVTRPAIGANAVDSADFATSGTQGFTDDKFVNGRAEILRDDGASIEYDITVEHTIPESEIILPVRIESSNIGPGLEVTFNGDTWKPVSDNAGLGPVGWDDLAQENYGTSELYGGGDVTPGVYTVRIEATAGGSQTDFQAIDIGTSADARYYDPDSWDNTVHEAGGHLDDPRTYPVAEGVFTDYESPFSVVGGAITLTINDTSNSQRVQLSNDRGDTYLPADGSEENTTSVDVDFATTGATIRTRVRLGAYSPQGARDATPRFGYAPQELDAYVLEADSQQESLLLDYSETQSLEDHLTQMAGDEYFWAYRIDDGVPTVTFIEPDARTGTDPDIINATVEKDLETYHKFTVYGANKRVVAEPFNASTSEVNLVQSDIVPGSETVTDPADGTNFDRGVDYEMDWQDGTIRAVASGALETSVEYEITYRYEVFGSYTDPNAPADFRERDVEIPAVTSQRNAEQIAYVLVEVDGFNEPRWSADITVPPGVGTFDVVESLPLETLDLPDDVGALEIEEPPEITPTGTSFRLGTRPPLEDRLSQLRAQVRQVARRSG